MGIELLVPRFFLPVHQEPKALYGMVLSYISVKAKVKIIRFS